MRVSSSRLSVHRSAHSAFCVPIGSIVNAKHDLHSLRAPGWLVEYGTTADVSSHTMAGSTLAVRCVAQRIDLPHEYTKRPAHIHKHLNAYTRSQTITCTYTFRKTDVRVHVHKHTGICRQIHRRQKSTDNNRLSHCCNAAFHAHSEAKTTLRQVSED